jgi:hypothetical protein
LGELSAGRDEGLDELSAGGDESLGELHLPEITFSTALAWAMRVADQICPPAGAETTGEDAASLLGPHAFPDPDLAGAAARAGANDTGDGGPWPRGAAGSNGVRSSSSKWRPMREGLVKMEGTAAAAAAVAEAAGTRGRVAAAAAGDAEGTGRSAGREVLRENERTSSAESKMVGSGVAGG